MTFETPSKRRTMGTDRSAVASREGQAEGRTAPCCRLRRIDWHSVRPAQRHFLRDAPPRDGLWQWNGLLAASPGVAKGWSLETPPPGSLGGVGPSRGDRLEPRVCGLRDGGGKKGGEQTGPNPTDKGKPGSKRHLVVDRQAFR